MHYPRDRIDQAVTEMLRQVAAGGEYPDVEWRVSQQFNLPADVLRDAYDNHHGDRR